ncbi:MAG TPA: hypothetical protein VFA15_00600, partial [Nitrososphaera sp.]|nr:hypothetical protein [Nitrososphaera sp.]
MIGDSQRSKQHGEIIDEKRPILQVAKKPKIDGKAQEEHSAFSSLCFAADHPLGDEPIDERRRPQQQNEHRISGCVKEIAGKEQVHFPHSPRQRQVMKAEYNEKKDKKRQRIEDHAFVTNGNALKETQAGLLSHLFSL